MAGWVATDRKRDATKKTQKQRRIPSINAKNARIWQICVLFALHEGRVGFGADPFNRTGRCTSSSAAAQQKKRQIALVSAICTGTAVAICTSRTSASSAQSYSCNTHGLVDTWSASQWRGHGFDSCECHFSVCHCIASTKMPSVTPRYKKKSRSQNHQ